MNEIENRKQNKITLNRKLKPIILEAILEIYNAGNQRISARMVKEKCIKIDSSIPWSGRLPAICNAMRNSNLGGEKIAGEDRDFMHFTIEFPKAKI